MSVWAALGLPPAQVGYSYDVDAGLVRTNIPAAQPRQVRRYETNKRTFQLRWILTHAQLRLAEPYLQTYGYGWHAQILVSGHGVGGEPLPHCVRLTDDYTVSALGYDAYEVSGTFEQLVERSVFATSAMYPLELIDNTGVANAPANSDVEQFQLLPIEGVGVANRPADATWSQEQTFFPTYYTDGAAESAAVGGQPSTPSWVQYETYFPAYYTTGLPESVSVANAPSQAAIEQYQELYPLYYQDGLSENIGVANKPAQPSWEQTA